MTSSTHARLLLSFLAGSALLPAHGQTPPAIGRAPATIYMPGGAAAEPADNTTRIKDIKALSAPDQPAGKGVDTATREFLSRNSKELGLDGTAGTFPVVESKDFPTGKRIRLQQNLNGMRVIGGNIQIAVSNAGAVESVAKNVVTIPAGKKGSIPTVAKLDEQAAKDIAWNHLGVTGELIEPPDIEKAYLNEQDALTLVYVVKLAVTEPFGYWEYTVDATTGRIAAKRDRRIKRLTDQADAPSEPLAPRIPRLAAERAFRMASASKAFHAQPVEPGSNSVKGYIFETNPVTAIKDGTLLSGDPPDRFSDAYRQVSHSHASRANQQIVLKNAFVRIEDFEPGVDGRTMAPSTASVEWTARRGDNAFNDFMTFYHISSNLEYLRKLGYRGSGELFPNGLAVDTDALKGADQSHYVPGSDRLGFGHGCVNDNEDTDVILHELAHAIHYHLNPDWYGGDSGAIGEGFGDYWAVSYRLRTPGGWEFLPGKVFVWDGIDACWGGRRADRANARFVPARRYQAHEQLDGFIADELWSTPLVSSLLELRALGESIESVDAVVLAGMTTIGSNFDMPALARRTVEAAKTLAPGKPHAQVLENNFRKHGILQ